MHKLRSRGFTLIELLVVIAIIGILSAVVLASLNTARSKGSDAAVQSDLDAIRTQAEIYYGGTGNNSYGTQAGYLGTAPTTGCTGGVFSDGTIKNALTGAASANGGRNILCAANGTAYVTASVLNSDATKAWCVDSTGVSRQVTTSNLATTLTACPAS